MARKPLGRGIEALITANDAGESVRLEAGSIREIPIDQVVPSRFQPRTHFDAETLEELAESIRSQGIVEPVIVRQTQPNQPYELIAGERRLRAARMAGLTRIPAIVRELDDRSALELSLVENLAREELRPIDEARALLRLNREFGLSHDAIARRIGKSRPYVTNSIRLLDLPAQIIEMLERGELTAGQARPLLALDSQEAQIKLALKIAAENLTARKTEALVRAARPANKSVRSPDANLNTLVEELEQALKRRVRIFSGRGRRPGRIEIEYYSDDDLTALVTLLKNI